MEVVDVFCGVGGFSEGASAHAMPILGVDNEDSMVRLWAANTKGRGLLAELWAEDVNWPVKNARLHIHMSPPCTALSKARRNPENVTLKIYTPLYMGCIHKDPLYKLKPCTCRDSRTMYRKHSM